MKTLRQFVVVALLVSAAACASAPPNASPQAATAFKKHEVQKDLDLIRDIAIDANALRPQPLLSEDSTRKVVTWHKAAITIIHETVNWQTAVVSSLEELKKALPEGERKVLDPYITLALGILKGMS